MSVYRDMQKIVVEACINQHLWRNMWNDGSSWSLSGVAEDNG